MPIRPCCSSWLHQTSGPAGVAGHDDGRAGGPGSGTAGEEPIRSGRPSATIRDRANSAGDAAGADGAPGYVFMGSSHPVPALSRQQEPGVAPQAGTERSIPARSASRVQRGHCGSQRVAPVAPGGQTPCLPSPTALSALRQPLSKGSDPGDANRSGRFISGGASRSGDRHDRRVAPVPADTCHAAAGMVSSQVSSAAGGAAGFSLPGGTARHGLSRRKPAGSPASAGERAETLSRSPALHARQEELSSGAAIGPVRQLAP